MKITIVTNCNMKITIVTLYRAGMCEHYVGAVEGELTDKQRRKLAKGFKAGYACVDADEDQIFFREVELQSKPPGLTDLLNIDDLDLFGDQKAAAQTRGEGHPNRPR
jgi:hypothetical protein